MIAGCTRKSAIADVTVISPGKTRNRIGDIVDLLINVNVLLSGTGKISINGKDITYFEEVSAREQVNLRIYSIEMLKCEKKTIVRF